MVQLTAVVQATDVFGVGMRKRLDALKRENQAALVNAAALATRSTRAGFTYRRDIAPPRAGRSSTGGQLRNNLTWRKVVDAVEFDVAAADARAPHWIIQEIGTGNKAVLRKPDVANPVGRPKAGANYVRRVPSQVGRRLPGGLVFASNGRYSPTGSATGEQIQLASAVQGAPRGAPGIKIRREIRPQHMVRDGGTQGFRQYKTTLLAAARQTFKK